MQSDEFRRHAHAFVDWMADYLASVEGYPVRAQTKPGEIAARLPFAPPEQGEAMETIFADFQSLVMPGITHWQHPSFFAYFPANASPPSLLAEMLTATLGAQGTTWQTSPAATEMEMRVLDWVRQMIGLPEGFHGVIQDSASSAILCAILTARERATGWRVNEKGITERMTVYCSAETHAATEKDAKVAGIGRANVRKVPTDARFAMRADKLHSMLREDLAAGATPTCVVASLGTPGVGAMDPLRPLGEVCRRHGVFFHVDAAWAGSALILPHHRALLDGIEHVDSFVFNPHKWLFTNFDCSAHFVRDPQALIRTFAINPVFLMSREGSQVVDYRDWGVQLGRRFRALKLWFVIRTYGVSGLRRMIAQHIVFAEELERWITAAPDFELLAPRSLTLLNFRYHPEGLDDPGELDKLNSRLLETLNDSGALYLTPNLVDGTYALRFAIGGTSTERRHVEGAWRNIQDTARSLAR